MKYPVIACPGCGCGDADEDAKGVGLIIGFHPQDPNKLKLPGTIFFVGCNHCQYVGPIVLCERGLSEKKVINAWNEHIKPGSTLATADLVRELERREGVEEFAKLNKDEFWHAYPAFPDGDSSNYSRIMGPAKILVIPGGEE